MIFILKSINRIGNIVDYKYTGLIITNYKQNRMDSSWMKYTGLTGVDYKYTGMMIIEYKL